MHRFKKSPFNRVAKQNSVDPKTSCPYSSNPFDSDSDTDNKQVPKPSPRTYLPAPITPNLNTNPSDNDERKQTSSSSPYSDSSSGRKKQENNFLEASCSSSSNPFDSDSDTDSKQVLKASRRAALPAIVTPNLNTKPFDNDERKQTSSSSPHLNSPSGRNKHENNFLEPGGLENQSLQELENYAVYKAEEMAESVNNCLKIAMGIREDATHTLVTLHRQGEQITKTHMVASNIDHDLTRSVHTRSFARLIISGCVSKGEKLLGSLGGIFSRTWKPKKNHPIKGPVIFKDGSITRRGSHLQQRERLGLSSMPTRQSNARILPLEPTNALQKVEVEKAKQEDTLSDLSNLLGELKVMAVDMGSEIERQNKALDHFHDDVDELNFRVKGANQRGRRLLGK